MSGFSCPEMEIFIATHSLRGEEERERKRRGGGGGENSSPRSHSLRCIRKKQQLAQRVLVPVSALPEN